jgi:hypothetical protein
MHSTRTRRRIIFAIQREERDMRDRSGYLGSLALGAVCALLCAPAAGQSERATETAPARQAPQTSFGSVIKSGLSTSGAEASALLGATIDLEQSLEIEASRSAAAAQTFGASLSAADRRELQGACTALVANPNDAAASRRLEQMMSRYRDNNAEAITRFCLNPAITQLQGELRASRQTFERLGTGGGDTQANIDMQNKLQQQQQTFSSISSVMKTRHDTAKNAISNVR